MSEKKIKDALMAMEYAHKVMHAAGVYFYTINSVRRENNIWLVTASSFLVGYTLKIDANTGDIIEFISK